MHTHETDFPIGARVRYKPGKGTYGYEDALETDGRVPGVVIGCSATRVHVELTVWFTRGGKGSVVTRAVDAASLVRDEQQPPSR